MHDMLNNEKNSSVFEKTIAQIIDTDQKAKKIIEEARNKSNRVNEIADDILNAYHEEKFKKADAAIAETKKELDMAFQNRLHQTELQSEKMIQSFEQHVENNKRAWEDSVFERMLEI